MIIMGTNISFKGSQIHFYHSFSPFISFSFSLFMQNRKIVYKGYSFISHNIKDDLVPVNKYLEASNELKEI